MRVAIYKAAEELEEASWVSHRWVLNKPRELLIQSLLAEGLEAKQEHAKAVFQIFIEELNDNTANLSEKKTILYLQQVKRVLYRRRRIQLRTVEGNCERKKQLEKECLQLNDGTTYLKLVEAKINAFVYEAANQAQKSQKVCEDAEYCEGCDNCTRLSYGDSQYSFNTYMFRSDCALAIGSVELWQAGLTEVSIRLIALQATQPTKTSRRKTFAPQANPWKGILAPKVTLYDLTRILVNAGILRKENSVALSSWVEKGSWPGIFQALYEFGKISPKNNMTKLYKAIIFQYGPAVTSQSTMRGYNPNNKHSARAYRATTNALTAEVQTLGINHYLQ
jgi:hypothetical protein